MTRKVPLRGAIRTLGKDEEIKRLRAENRRLRKALRRIAVDDCSCLKPIGTTNCLEPGVSLESMCERCFARYTLRPAHGRTL